uniref:Secreted protein n=1 Tax=Rhipicephalus appendiculatus TaxID=34631 RepID=A0A131YCU6_RHIAP
MASLFLLLLLSSLLLPNFLRKEALGMIIKSPVRNFSFTGHKLSNTFSYFVHLDIYECFSLKKKMSTCTSVPCCDTLIAACNDGDEAWL